MQVSNLGKYLELSHVASVQTCNALIFLDHWITEAQEEEFCHTILKQTNKQKSILFTISNILVKNVTVRMQLSLQHILGSFRHCSKSNLSLETPNQLQKMHFLRTFVVI